jgi:hypothetical protein
MKLLIFAIGMASCPIFAQTAPPAAPVTGTAVGVAKAFGAGDLRFARETAEVIHFQLKLLGRWNGIKELEPEFSKWLQPRHVKLTSLWTPFATMCVEHQVKNLPTDVSKKDAAELAKNPTAKQKGFRLAHLETMAKSSKRALKEMESAAKGIQHPDLKAWADNVLPVMKTNAEEFEARYLEEKKLK